MTPEQRTRKNARSAERMRQLRADPVWREEFNRRRREDPAARARDAERSLRYNYGLTSEQYAAMFASQGGLCAVCRGRGGKKGLVVDHCHETGVVRGLLCHRCNVGIGALGDAPAALRRAVKYLTDARRRQQLLLEIEPEAQL